MTIAALQARALNELKRPNLTSEAADAIASAIEFYSDQPFWFLEGSDTYATTSESHTLPDDFRMMRLVTVTTSGGQVWPLGDAVSFETYRNWMITSETGGEPFDWTTFGGRLYLYPTPASEVTVTLYYTMALPAPAEGEDNAWTTSAEALIRTRAKWDLLFSVVRQYEEANAQGGIDGNGGLCATYLNKLLKRTAGQGKPRFVVPTRF